jgi:hypothetical protein
VGAGGSNFSKNGCFTDYLLGPAIQGDVEVRASGLKIISSFSKKEPVGVPFKL